MLADVDFGACDRKAEFLAKQPDPSLFQNNSNLDWESAGVMAGAGALGGAAAALTGAFTGGGPNLGEGVVNGVGSAFGFKEANCQTIPESPKVPTQCEGMSQAGKFNPKLVDAAIADAIRAGSIASCKAAQSKRAKEVMDCFRLEHQYLKEQLGKVKEDFDKNVEGMKQFKQRIEAEVEKETIKREGLKGRAAAYDSQAKALEGVLAKLRSATSSKGSTDNISGLQIRMNELNRLEQDLERTKRQVKANRTAFCFQNAGATTSRIRQCPNQNYDLLSPKACILSLYQDEGLVQAGGGTVKHLRGKDKRQAENRRKLFENRLDQMMADFGGINPRTPTYESFYSKYSKELLAFGRAGSAMLEELRGCFDEVNSDVEKRELSDARTELGGRVDALNRTAEQFASEMTAQIEMLNPVFRNSYRELFNDEPLGAVNPIGCTVVTTTTNSSVGPDGQPIAGTVRFDRTSLGQQMNCIQGLEANLRTMLDGTPAPGSSLGVVSDIKVPGVNSVEGKCQGLRQCAHKANELAAKANNRIDALNGSGTFDDPMCGGKCPGKKKFIVDANRNLKASFQSTAKLLSDRMIVAKRHFERAKSLLKNTGLTFPLAKSKVGKVNVDAVCKGGGPDEICSFDENFGDQLATASGLPDIQDEAFDTLVKDADSNIEKAQAKLATYPALIRELKEFKERCRQKSADDLATKKAVGIRARFNIINSKCKTAASGLKGKQVESAGANFDQLAKDLLEVCSQAATTITECSTLSTELASADTDCRQVLEDKALAKADTFVTTCRTKYPELAAYSGPDKDLAQKSMSEVDARRRQFEECVKDAQAALDRKVGAN